MNLDLVQALQRDASSTGHVLKERPDIIVMLGTAKGEHKESASPVSPILVVMGGGAGSSTAPTRGTIGGHILM